MACLRDRERVLASAVAAVCVAADATHASWRSWLRRSASRKCDRRARRRKARFDVPSRGDRDEALKVFLQNLLDSLLIAFKWGIRRCWSVRVD
jgi:hypothetical protein